MRHRAIKHRAPLRWLALLAAAAAARGGAQGGAWQQDVRYTIQARLDVRTSTLVASEFILYYNNSPDTLSTLRLHLYPNAYRDRNTVFGRELERMGSYDFSFAPARDRGFIEVRKVDVEGRRAVHRVDETEMEITLERPLAPGDSTTLDLDFFVKIPRFFSRLGHQGNHYEITQWYPKMVVYDPMPAPLPPDSQWPDSLRSDSSPAPKAIGPFRSARPPRSAGRFASAGYHALGEFYGEFGTFDVTLTVPANMMVGATGTLVEPESETAWMRRPLAERKKMKPGSVKTLRFRAENVHDFAWVADPDYVLLSDTLAGVTVSVLVRSKNEKDWRPVTGYAKDALHYFSRWFGRYPYPGLTVCQGSFTAGGGMEYPTLVIISSAGVPWTRMLETTVIHEIGHQWFYGILGSNELAEPWLDEGMTTFAEIRYLEAKYGPDNFFRWPGPFETLPNMSDRYLHRFIYQVAADNRVEQPILTPAGRFLDNPVAYQAAAYSKAALVMDMFRAQVGDSVFDLVMQRYCERFKFRHPRTGDFVAVVRDAVAREVSGFDPGRFFDRWLRTTETCDYRVKKVRSLHGATEVTVERRGGLVMPVTVRAVTRAGAWLERTWDGSEKTGVVRFESSSPVRRVVVDPDTQLLEIDRWNNYWPPRIEVKPVFDFPGFDAYQVFYCPYVWFNGSDGLALGVYFQGRKFIDYDFLKGAHEWFAGIVYGFRSRSWKPSFNYQTPLPVLDRRVRVRLGGNTSLIETNFNFGFAGKFGPLLRPSATEFLLEYRYGDLRDLGGKDLRDWVLARTGLLNLNLGRNWAGRILAGRGRLNGSWASPKLGGNFEYFKLTGEAVETVRLTPRTRVTCRFFLGRIWGAAPAQHQFFLSGSLLPTGVEPLTLAYQKTWATQEHWHITGDANLRGYAGGHVRGTTAGALTVTASGFGLPVTPFFDLGTVGAGALDFRTIKADGGLSVHAGPFFADFPFWVSSPPAGEPHFKFRWLVGASLALGFSVP